MRKPLAPAFLILLSPNLLSLPAAADPAASWPDGPFPRIGPTTISTINENDANGFSNIEFSTVSFRGVVQLATGVLDPLDQGAPSSWYYVSDGTGTVALVHAGSIPVNLVAGDSVSVTSGLVITQGTDPVGGTRTVDLSFGGSVAVVGSSQIVDPVAATANDIATNGAAFEGSRVRVSGLRIVSQASWPGGGSSGFVEAYAGTDTVSIYVDEDTNLDGAVPPGDLFELVAFVGQNDVSFPFTQDHHLYPTGTSDIVAGDGSGLVAVTPTSVLENASGLSLGFTVTGQTVVLGSVEIEIPLDWTWGDTNDFAISGPGFAGAAASSSPSGGTFVVTVTGANVTSVDTGTVTIGTLTSTSSVGLSTFTTRTATPGGTLTEISNSPRVSVQADAQPGDIVINELFAFTRIPGSTGSEEAEFVELYNASGGTLDIGGWKLSDIGRTRDCTLDPGWLFPPSTIVPAGGYVVVCRTALDPTSSPVQGFTIDFPSLPPGALLFEMFDAQLPVGSDADHASTPNMIPVEATSADEQIALLGGQVTNTGQCASLNGVDLFLPFAELVVLEDASAQVIDVVEYREPGPCVGDLCEVYTGPDDAYAFGPPKLGHTLGRDAASADTDVSRDDLLPASIPTPGEVNQPGDTVGPTLTAAPLALSAAIVELRFDELVDDTALDPSRYSVYSPALGESLAVSEVLFDPEEGGIVDTGSSQITVGRHFFLVADAIPAGTSASLTISGVQDVPVGGGSANPLNTTRSFSVGSELSTVCEIQAFDEIGFSPLERDTVVITGFVTVGDIDAVGVGGTAPTDRISIWVQEPGGCGVNVFSFLPDDQAEYEMNYPDVRAFGVRLNDLVQIRGRVTEFVSGSSGAGAVTEIASIDADVTFYRFLLRGLDGPEPIRVVTRDANDEALEGTLIRTEGTVINSNSLAAYIDDGSGSIQVFQNFSAIDLTRFTVGDRLDVTGIITQFDSSSPYFAGYELVPQNQDAIVLVSGNFASGDPELRVTNRVLVPSLGETIEIVSVSPQRSDVILEIYDSLGRKVTTLYDGVGLGEVSHVWDGTTDRGARVDPGVFVCHMRSVPLDGGSVKSESAPIVVGVPLQ